MDGIEWDEMDTILTNINRDDVNHDIELKNLLSDDSNSSKNGNK